MIRFARERVTRATLTSPTWTALRAHFLPTSQSGRITIRPRARPFFREASHRIRHLSLLREYIECTVIEKWRLYIYTYVCVCVCVMEKARQISGRKCHRRSYRSDHLRHCSLIHVDKLIYGPVESGMRVRM